MQSILRLIFPDLRVYIVACRQKAEMIEEIGIDFLGNDRRSRGSG
jgi:hypothetical protein